MKSIYQLKLVIVGFFVLQSFFSIFYKSLSSNNNAFPLYTWRVFHPRPDKYLIDHVMSIHRIDNETFNPPIINLIFIKERFPHMRIYALTTKIISLNRGNPLRKKTIKNINTMLLKKNYHIRWGVVERKYNPIELFWRGKVIYQKGIETFDAKKDM